MQGLHPCFCIDYRRLHSVQVALKAGGDFTSDGGNSLNRRLTQQWELCNSCCLLIQQLPSTFSKVGMLFTRFGHFKQYCGGPIITSLLFSRHTNTALCSSRGYVWCSWLSRLPLWRYVAAGSSSLLTSMLTKVVVVCTESLLPKP